MITVTVEEAQAQMSKLLRRAKAGETVIITMGPENAPVATLEWIKAPSTSDTNDT